MQQKKFFSILGVTLVGVSIMAIIYFPDNSPGKKLFIIHPRGNPCRHQYFGNHFYEGGRSIQVCSRVGGRKKSTHVVVFIQYKAAQMLSDWPKFVDRPPRSVYTRVFTGCRTEKINMCRCVHSIQGGPNAVGLATSCPAAGRYGYWPAGKVIASHSVRSFAFRLNST